MFFDDSKFIKTLLVVAGAVLIVIATWVTADPTSFYASNGITLGDNISLTNELRAPAGILLVFGVLIVCGAVLAPLRHTAVIAASVIYLSYGLARLLGVAIDGLPTQEMVLAMIVELVFGVLFSGAWLIERTQLRRAYLQSA